MSAENQPSSAGGEWIKFGVLVAVMVITVIVIAIVAPIVSGTIVPKVMGWDKPAISTPSDPSAPAEEAPAAEMGEAEAEEAGEIEEMGEVEQVEMADPEAYPAPEEGETAVAPPAEEPLPVNSISYTVKAGDTLYDIARAYGTTIEEIVAASDSISRPSDVIKPGMVLSIPRP